MSDNILRFDFTARDQASPTFEKLGRESDGLGAKMSKFGGAAKVALFGATAAAGGFAVAGVAMGIKTAAAMEQAQVGFTTLLGSGEKAKSFLDGLKKFAAATPFDLPGLVDSSRLLVGVGLSAKDTMAVLQNFGDAAGAVGVSQEAFQRIMLATSQAISAGKFQAGDLNQITEAGIPIWKILSEAMGMPVTKIRELSSQGKLLSSDVLPLLEKQMHKDYGGAMAKQSQTLNGLWSSFMDTLQQGLGNAIAPLIPALDKGLVGATKAVGGALKGLPGLIDTVTGKFQGFKTLITTKIAPELGDVFGNIKAKLPHIDISAIGQDFKGEAVKWAGQIIAGVQEGFSHGNWGPLGKTLGDGLSTAITASASGAAKFGVAVGKWFGGLDWFSIGEAVGNQAFPFVVGFFTTMTNGLIKTAKEHPLDTALFVISLIPIGKLATAFGPLREFITKIPFGGWVISALDHTAAPVYDAVANFVRRFMGLFGKTFVDEFPSLSKILDRGMGGLADGIRLRIAYAIDAGREFVDGIATGMARGAASIIREGALLVRQMVEPYANAGRWLINAGRDFVAGFVNAAIAVGGTIDRAMGSLIRRATGPFAKAGGWLITRGRETVSGFITGVGNMFGPLSSRIAASIQRIRSPFTKAGTWLFQTGRQIMSGLFQGMVNGVAAAGSFASRVGGSIVRAVKGYFGIKSPSKVMMGIGSNLISSLFLSMVNHNPVPIMGKIFGGMPEALGQMAEKGLVSIKNLPSKAINALSGLGGALGSKLSGLLGIGGAKLGGGLSAAEKWIIMHESGGRTTAKNPTSTAFGLGQLLAANRAHYGAILGVSANTTNYNDQLAMFRMYVRDRYGNAQNAQAFWEAHGWYGSGGLVSKRSVVGLGERGPERILSAQQTRAFENLVPYLSRIGGASQSASDSIDYGRLAKLVGREMATAIGGMAVTMDGKAVGRVAGHRTSLLVRGG